MKKRILLIIGLVIFLAGCAPKGPNIIPGDPNYAPKNPPKPPENTYAGGAIFQPDEYRSVYADTSSHRVGDILTVILVEKTNGRKIAKTTQQRDTGGSIKPRFGLGGIGGSNDSYKVYRPELSVDTRADFKGNADSAQSNSLTGTITVSVVQVLNNGNLKVRGEKWITINRGREYIRLSGIVRPEDITDENTVFSGQIANARIQYSGTGQFADTNEPGWLSKFFMGMQ